MSYSNAKMHPLNHKKKINFSMENRKYNIIGIMSGTSCDGLDIAHCLFYKKKNNWVYELVNSFSVEYPKKLKDRLINCSQLDALSLKILDIDLGEFIKNHISEFIKSSKSKFDLISSHGHTVFHNPNKKLSYQIGNPFIIYNSIKIPVVFNFRELDVIMGGEGAPLVPYGDKKLFNDFDYCINIGGILNISKLHEKELFGYDVCPANIILNKYSRELNKEYDIDGRLSISGSFNTNLFNALNKIDYYKDLIPKSLDISFIEKIYYPLFTDINPKDILYTFVNHIAYQVNNAIEKKKSRILLTGGGAFNTHLLEKICNYNKHDHKFIVPNKSIIIFKEAIIFAFLGLLRFLNHKNISKSVTGSNLSSSSGLIVENKIID